MFLSYGLVIACLVLVVLVAHRAAKASAKVLNI